MMTYDRKPADEKIVQLLQDREQSARPAEIAEETGYHQGYVTRRCKAMADAGILIREEGGYIIGHDIPGLESPVILSGDRDHLLAIVQDVAPEQLPEVRGLPVDELRKFIKEELATATYPLGNRKVSYAAA